MNPHRILRLSGPTGRECPSGRRRAIALLIGGVLGAWASSAASAGPDWSAYLGDLSSGQSSSLDEIDRANVHRLEVAWIYRSGAKGQIQCNPLVIDGVLYGTSAALKLFALDAATGEERWAYEPEGASGLGIVNRGLATWGEAGQRRIFFAAGSKLYAVDASTGAPIDSFGSAGSVDLKEGLGRDAEKLSVVSTTPGVVYKDLYVVTTRVSESNPSAPGHIRAYNVLTGEPVWTFHTIPQPGEFGEETWPEGAWERAGGANCWAGMSLDAERGIVYVPTGSAAFDFYGADRLGSNLFANCLIALKADTGERLWHFQIVHHDLWDRDLPAPPNLVTLRREGRRIDAVAQITKSAHVFIFDRVTGEPIFPIEERAVPVSDLQGERAWPTQPFPTKPPPFARQKFTEDDVTDLSPEAHDYVLDRLKRSRAGGPFVPPSREGTIVLPGFDGGGEWGGAAVDPETAILYVNSSAMAWVLTMFDIGAETNNPRASRGRRLYAKNCLHCHGVDRRGDPLEVYPPLLDLDRRISREAARELIRKGKGRMEGFARLPRGDVEALLAYLYESGAPEQDHEEENRIAEQGARAPDFTHTGYNRFVDPEGYPAVKPPWGTLNAIDLNEGEILWQVTLGELPELTARGIAPTGTETYGGPIVTAGGLLFIGATKDEMFRAFDKETGEVLWEAKLPAGGYATPATYQARGRQYVVIAAGGAKMGTAPGDAYVAFALPD